MLLLLLGWQLMIQQLVAIGSSSSSSNSNTMHQHEQQSRRQFTPLNSSHAKKDRTSRAKDEVCSFVSLIKLLCQSLYLSPIALVRRSISAQTASFIVSAAIDQRRRLHFFNRHHTSYFYLEGGCLDQRKKAIFFTADAYSYVRTYV